MKINSISTPHTTSFKGNEIKGVSKFLRDTVYPKVAESKPFQKVATSLSYTDKSFKGIMLAESILLSGFYMINTIRNKKIKKEQKPQMLINDALTLGVSSAGAILLDDKISDIVAKGSEKYIANRKDFYRKLGEKEINTHINDFMTKVGEALTKTGKGLEEGAKEAVKTLDENMKEIVTENGKKLKPFQITKDKLEEAKQAVQEIIKTKPSSEAKEAVENKVKELYSNLAGRLEAKKFEEGMKKVKTLIVFGIIYRYIGPVIVTPLANKLSKKFFGNPKTENKK